MRQERRRARPRDRCHPPRRRLERPLRRPPRRRGGHHRAGRPEFPAAGGPVGQPDPGGHRHRHAGRVLLFFGARTAAECLCRDEPESYRDEPGFEVRYAFSREQRAPDGRRMYVHHRMAERAEELWRLLDLEDTYLHLCGIKGMEDGVERVLRGRAERDYIDWRAFRRVL
ncbi:ferredoxin reductase domain-containing protein [Tautonia plasticadhaerens]|nr:hypothetical protein [Tautonia plasticadhaerens]